MNLKDRKIVINNIRIQIRELKDQCPRSKNNIHLVAIKNCLCDIRHEIGDERNKLSIKRIIDLLTYIDHLYLCDALIKIYEYLNILSDIEHQFFHTKNNKSSEQK